MTKVEILVISINILWFIAVIVIGLIMHEKGFEAGYYHRLKVDNLTSRKK